MSFTSLPAPTSLRFRPWALLLLAASGCKKESAEADAASVSLEMENVVGAAPLAFDGRV